MNQLLLKYAFLAAATISAVPAMTRAQQPPSALQPMQRTVSPLKLSGERLRDIVGRMGGSAGVRVSVNWEACRLNPDSIFDVSLSGVTLEAALGMLLEQTPWMDANGAVMVGASADGVPSTYRYPVGDLARAESLQLPQGMESLTSLVEHAVQTDSWEGNGGNQGGLTAAGDTLVVRQTPGGHADVQRLLATLRAALAAQPAVVMQNDPLAPESALRRPVENAAFANVPLREVLERLSRDTHLNVIVDIEALEHAGISMDLPVTIDLSKLTFEKAIDQLLSEIDGNITTDVAGGILRISTRDASRAWVDRRVYDVRQIINGLTADPPTSPGDPKHTPIWDKCQPQDATDAITKLLEDLIEPEIWRDNGGAVGAIDFFAGHMVVNAPPAAHRQITLLLALMDDAVTPRPAPPAEGIPVSVGAPTTEPAPKPTPEISVNLNFDNTPFQQALNQVIEKSHARVFVNWKILEAAGIDRNTPVTFKIGDVKGYAALNLILDAVGGAQVKLSAVRDEDGIIHISTAEDHSKQPIIRFYNIQGLVEGAMRVNREFDANAPRAQPATAQDIIDSITKVIEDTVDAASWKDNGGAVGTLRIFANTLIVCNTEPNQVAVEALLKRLSKEVGITATTRHDQ